VHLLVYFDGACEPKNPGGVGTYGFAVYNDNDTISEGYGIACEPAPNCTNNVAEYTGLIKALECLLLHDYGESSIVVRGDSQLVIKQLTGIYNVRTEHLKPLFEKAHELLSHFRVRLEWIPRELNSKADELSKRAYIEYLDEHPELINKFKPYLATEKQLKLLKELGIEPYKYMSKMEASRLIRKLLNKRKR